MAKKAKRAGATRAAAVKGAPAKPAAVKITAAKGRPMLTWVGKRPLAHVTAYPAQLIERFRPKLSNLSSQSTSPNPPNLLFHGDNKDVLAWLLANGYRGKVQLVYIDPPFDSGADYVRKVNLRGPKGSMKVDGESYSLGEQIQYTDIWANDNYLQFMYERLLLLREVLSDEGSIVLHVNSAKSHQLRILLDEVFGAENFRNEITWHYVKYQMGGTRQFVDNTDRLLWYSKGESWIYERQVEQLAQPKELLAKGWDKEKGVIVNLRNDEGRTYKIQITEEKVDDFWSLNDLGPVVVRDAEGIRVRFEKWPVDNAWLLPYIAAPSHERTDYPTQKPRILIERIVKALSKEDGLVLDAYIGSGTTADVAQRLGRQWIGCDINKGAIQTTLKRLQAAINEQAAAEAPNAQGTLLEVAAPVVHGPLAIDVYRVNDYDLQIQHNEAVALACDFLGVQRNRGDRYFDGTRGKQLVKITPFNHPLSPVDLDVMKQELEGRPEEDRDILVVCLGIEQAARKWVDDWNSLRKKTDRVNRIEIIELRSDPKYGGFMAHSPAKAKVSITRKKGSIAVSIDDFISPTIVERLRQQAGVLEPKIDDWRAMVDSVMIDTAYDGRVFNVVLTDIPAKKTDYVNGTYEIPAPKDKTTVAVKITDMLGEEVLVTKSV